ncbi:hypothetical protein B6E66_07090 [Streptomyces maremycinicus]|nr:hypothetical protein B6E66_07090 [Streptomyces sp. B9173]
MPGPAWPPTPAARRPRRAGCPSSPRPRRSSAPPRPRCRPRPPRPPRPSRPSLRPALDAIAPRPRAGPSFT